LTPAKNQAQVRQAARADKVESANRVVILRLVSQLLRPENQKTGLVLVRISQGEKTSDSNHRNRLCQEV
jgi:hypothetical protein